MVLSKMEYLQSICKIHEIGLLYLFGSQEENIIELLRTGNEDRMIDPMADVDIGVVFLFDFREIKRRYMLYSSIYNDLEDIFLPYKLDLVFLQECNSILQYEAIKGTCVYRQSELFQEQFEMNVLRRLPDFKYMFNQYKKEVFEQYK